MPIRKRAFFQTGCVMLTLALWLFSGLASRREYSRALAAPQAQTYAPLSIIISEVAWGGTAASPYDEWIELYNPGSTDIDLSGWRLVADDGIPNIPLAGVIPAGGFFLLERSDDNTISDIAADQIYTGDLENAGEFLHLKAPNGSDVDTANADGGPWPAGSAAPGYYSMERRDLVPDNASAWVSNNGIHRNGKDANGNPINGTPKRFNSQWPATPTPTPTLIPSETLTPSLTFTPSETLTPSLTLTPSETASLTPTPSTTHTQTTTPTRTFTITPPAPSRLVISEFRTRGPNGGHDEFVEIFNPTGGAVDISGWTIKKSSGCGSSVSTLLTVNNGVILKPGQYFLAVASTGSSLTVSADQTFSPGIADDGGLALVSDTGTIVDRVGMCIDTLYYEGLPLAPMTGNTNQSYARQPDGKGCHDVNNNSLDFALRSPSQPQNRASPRAICAGVITFTPSHTPTATRRRTPTPLPPLPATLVINEVLPFPRSDWNGDGVVDARDEYIEIMNISTNTISLKGWKLDDEEDGSPPYSLPDRLVLPGGIVRLFGHETRILLGNGGDSVRLFHPIGRIVDAFTYPAVETADVTWCRLPDGQGGFGFTCRPTPGRPNARFEGQTRPPDAIGESTSTCSLPKAAPLPVLLAECESPGLKIWNWHLGQTEPYWIEDRYRWPVFLE